MVNRALGAAAMLAAEGIHTEVIDPRTVAPLDLDTILRSVAKTGRLVVVDQAPRHSTVGGIIAADVAEFGFSSLRAPILQVNALDTTVPYSEPLEAYVIPDEARIVAAVRRVMQTGR
jgi:pyruvate dehydrogenase E1 component beta subunit